MGVNITVYRYLDEYKNEWDNHIRNSKNPHFFFMRDFIEYNKNSFNEHSLVIKRGGKIAAVLPGNTKNNIFYSYQGLTYGGLLVNDKIRTENTGILLDRIIAYLKKQGVTKIVYKKMPYIYNEMPYDEDIYHLVKRGAQIYSGEIGEVVDYSNFKTSSRREDMIKKAKDSGIEIVKQDSFAKFWQLLKKNLKKEYGAEPTHTLNEIEYLASKFPENIQLFTAELNQTILSGTVLFINNKVAHTQYIGSSDQGHKYHSLDYLLSKMIDRYNEKKYFSFGICTENKGQYLNEGLAFFKESFGARGVVNLTFQLSI